MTMCIIATDSNSKDLRVHNTKIFVMPNKDRTRQLTVYQNTVACSVQGVMILPIPYPETFQVETELPMQLFEQLHSSVRDPLGAYSHLGMHLYAYRSLEPLPKFTMPGGYVASLAHTLKDLERVDTATFELSDAVLAFLDAEYSMLDHSFGFLVCKLSEEKTTEVEYTPISYSHAMIQKDKLFVPTLHYHESKESHNNIDWDHWIYSTETDIYANTPGFIPRDLNVVFWKGFPLEFQYDRLSKIHCLRLQGIGHPNQDLYFTIQYSRIAKEWTGITF